MHRRTSAPLAGALSLCVLILPGCSGDASGPDLTPAAVRVSPAGAVTLAALGETTTLTGTVTNAAGDALSDVAVSWSTSDASVATVSQSGVVEAVANGSADVRASAGSLRSDPVAVTVSQAVARVVIDDPDVTTLSLERDTVRLSATATDAGGAVMDEAIEWRSSDESVATVDAEGLVTGVIRGEASITAVAGGVESADPVAITVLTPAAEVRVTAAPDAGADALEVAGFAEALAKVATGGTIRVADGEYVVEDVVIDRAVTLVAEGTGAVIRNESAAASFVVDGVPEGAVVFRALALVNTSLPAPPAGGLVGGGRVVAGDEAGPERTYSIVAMGAFAEVRIEDVVFESAAEATGAVRLVQSEVPGASATVWNSDFTGGLNGVGVVDVEGRPELRLDVRIEGGTFTDNDVAVQLVGTSATVTGTEFMGCGFACVWHRPGLNGPVAGVHEVVAVTGNTFRSCGRICIGARAEETTIRDNELLLATDPATRRSIQIVTGEDALDPIDVIIGGNRFENCGFDLCIGLFGAGPTVNALLEDNVLLAAPATEQTTGGNTILYAAGASIATVDRNEFQRCGTRVGHCVWANGATEVWADDNVITAGAEDVHYGFVARGGARIIAGGNTIDATTPTTDPGDWSQYGLRTAFEAGAGSTVEAIGNSVTGAISAFRANEGATRFYGHGNTATSVFRAAFWPGPGDYKLTDSDFTDFVRPFEGSPGPGSLGCIWWGSVDGPANVPDGTDPRAFTPWRTAPFGAEGSACDGGVGEYAGTHAPAASGGPSSVRAPTPEMGLLAPEPAVPPAPVPVLVRP